VRGIARESLPQGASETPDRAHGRNVTPRPGVRWWVIVLGLVLVVINARWVNEIENIRDYTWPSMFSLPLNVISVLFILTLVNSLFRRSAPRLALAQPELLVLYSMLAVGSVIAGWSFVPLVVAWSVAPLARATVENGWQDLFLHLFPNWLVLKDERAVMTLLTGESSFWQVSTLRAWAAPVAGWTLFLLLVTAAMGCVNVIVRRRWTDEERLTFPAVRLPFEMTRPDAGLLRNRWLWLGFCLSSMSALLSGTSLFYPSIPALPTPLLQLGDYLRDAPWNAMTAFGLPIRVYPWLVGFGMLMPQEVLFSYWFFFWFIQLQRVAAAAFGWQPTSDFPYVPMQVGGAILAFAPAIIWSSRTYLMDVWRRAWRRPDGLDDSDEPVSYRAALIGLVVCVSAMLGMLWAAGMSPWLGVAILAIYFAFALTASRVRAEIGGPTNGVGLLYHDALLVGTFGASAFRPRDLAMLSLTSWWGTAYGQDPTPQQIEGFKLAQLARFNMRTMLIALMLAAVVGTPAAFATLLGPMYRVGADTAACEFGADHIHVASMMSYSRLQNWLSAGAPPDAESSYQLVAMGAGFAFSLVLYALRSRYFWWPFHPLGFVMAGNNYYTYFFWPSIFVAWLTKSLLFRHGGRKAYATALPLFFGFILGDALMGSFWNLFGSIRRVFVFSVWI